VTYKSLLLHLEADPGRESCEGLALVLAARFGAHLTGLALAVDPDLTGYELSAMMIEALNAQREAAMKEAKATAERFRQTAEHAGQSVECRIESCFSSACTEVINIHARYCDLVIMAQSDPDTLRPCGAHLPEHVVLSSGRPLLIAPRSGKAPDPGKRITVAWDASREAMRAVSDAIPFLEQADAVQVLTVNAESRLSGHGADPGADIALLLSRYGCPVEVRAVHAADGDVGGTILSSLNDFSADLLVMGAYGHWRLRELVLGGVTQKVLAEMPLHVLMAH
jgi:nucleotide-binding universal stress UspA family protein